MARQQPIRSATSLFLRFVLTCALVVGLARGAQAQNDPDLELSLEQAHALAVHALKSGDPGLAIQISKRILQVSPKDATAYYVIAVAHANLKQPHEGRVAAAKAYRLVKPGPGRFKTAQLAARMAYEEDRPSLAQIWLRRTAIHAQTEENIEQVGRDYKILRQINPWTFRLNGGVRPSNNVNNGADTALNIIDGVPDNGTTPPEARALSGVIGTLDVIAGYRLHSSNTQATIVSGRLYVQRVQLSSDAKAEAPGASGSDFGSTYAEVALTHAFAVGPPAKKGVMFLGLSFGETWYADERAYRFARIKAQRTWYRNPKLQFRLLATGERRYKARYTLNDARVFSLGAEVTKTFENGDVLDLSLAQQDTNAQAQNGTYTSTSLLSSYTFSRPIGPAKLTLGMVLGFTNYKAFLFSRSLGVRARKDKSAYADITLNFYKYDYAGFVPTLRIRAGKRSSNYSRFDTRELSVSLGIASKF